MDEPDRGNTIHKMSNKIVIDYIPVDKTLKKDTMNAKVVCYI